MEEEVGVVAALCPSYQIIYQRILSSSVVEECPRPPLLLVASGIVRDIVSAAFRTPNEFLQRLFLLLLSYPVNLAWPFHQSHLFNFKLKITNPFY